MRFTTSIPPIDTPPALREYLIRMFQQIPNNVESLVVVPSYTKLPQKNNPGEIALFTEVIAPAIPTVGLYYNDGAQWIKLG